MKTYIRTVKLSNLNKPGSFSGGSHYTTHGYTNIDLATLFNVKESTIRSMIYRKLFDPTSLLSIINFYNSRQNHKPIGPDFAQHQTNV